MGISLELRDTVLKASSDGRIFILPLRYNISSPVACQDVPRAQTLFC